MQPCTARCSLSALIIGAMATVAAGQGAPPPEPPPQRGVRVAMDSGDLAAPKIARGRSAPIFSATVESPGAAWLRIPLDGVRLAGDPAFGDGAFLILTSMADGGMQRLDADSLQVANHVSAFFNGPAVRIELHAFGGTGASRVAIESVIAGVFVEAPASICGPTDDRTPILDLRAARGGGGCTVWTFDDLNSSMISAGHCASAVSSLALFNVPPSLANGTIQNPPPNDQYPMDASSLQSFSGGVGNDWAYIGVLPNSNHGLVPFQRYGVRYTLAASAPAVAVPAQTIRITGYGSASGVLNQTEKTHTGPFASHVGTTIRYQVDTTGGNSGSPVVEEASGRAIGIHTHAGCTSTGGSNQGTAIQIAGLQNALRNPRGVCASGNGAVAGTLYALGDRQNNFGTVSVAPNRFAKIAQIGALWQGLAWDRVGGHFYAIDGRGDLSTITPGGQMSVLGAVSESGVLLAGLTMDPTTRTLLAMAPATGQLYRIDPMTRIVSAVGTARGGSVRALGYDTLRRRLCGIEASGTLRLVAIDTSTGQRTDIGPLAFSGTYGAMAFDEPSGSFLALSSGGTSAPNGTVVRINALTGQGSAVGNSAGVFGPAFGLASTTACRADFNADGNIDPDDLAEFVTCFFSVPACGSADFNGDGSADPDDLSDFITVFFTPAC